MARWVSAVVSGVVDGFTAWMNPHGTAAGGGVRLDNRMLHGIGDLQWAVYIIASGSQGAVAIVGERESCSRSRSRRRRLLLVFEATCCSSRLVSSNLKEKIGRVEDL